MPAVNFYELAVTPVDKVLPTLVLKAYEGGLRGNIFAADEAELELLNKAIWTFKQDAFIPHGSVKDGKPERQFFFLSTGLENPNGATVAFVTGGRMVPGQYEKIADIFDGTGAAQKEAAESRKQQYLDKGFVVSHFRQNNKAGWEAAEPMHELPIINE